MCEIVKNSCVCNTGCANGAIMKTIENNIFTIFGNLNQGNTIVIRYHGILTSNSQNKSYRMFYYFDNLEEQKQYIDLSKCEKCVGDEYCACIDLNNYSNLSFGFLDNENNTELNLDKPFSLKISKDPITELMQKYGFEQNNNLPVCDEQNKIVLNKFKEIIVSIKAFFVNMFANKAI